MQKSRDATSASEYVSVFFMALQIIVQTETDGEDVDLE